MPVYGTIKAWIKIHAIHIIEVWLWRHELSMNLLSCSIQAFHAQIMLILTKLEASIKIHAMYNIPVRHELGMN